MGVAIQITSPLLIAASKNGLLYSRQNGFGVLYNSSGVFKRTNPPSFPEKSVVLGSCNSSIIFFVSISYLPNIVVVALGSAMISIPEVALYSRRFISASTPFTFGDAPLHSADAFPPLSPAAPFSLCSNVAPRSHPGAQLRFILKQLYASGCPFLRNFPFFSSVPHPFFASAPGRTDTQKSAAGYPRRGFNTFSVS